MENVPLLATSSRFVEFTKLLEHHKYHWAAAVVNAALYGSCQTRQRLVLVAIHQSVRAYPCLPKSTHGGDRRYFSFRDTAELMKLTDDPIGLLGATPAAGRAGKSVAVLDLDGKRPTAILVRSFGRPPLLSVPRAARALSHIPWSHGQKMVREWAELAEGGRWSGGNEHFSQSYGRLHRRGLARTITSYFSNPGSGRFWHPDSTSNLTLREAARIQGIDDSFRFGDSRPEQPNCVGNALDFAIAQAAYKAVRNALD